MVARRAAESAPSRTDRPRIAEFDGVDLLAVGPSDL
jgi:hypothetical protein